MPASHGQSMNTAAPNDRNVKLNSAPVDRSGGADDQVRPAFEVRKLPESGGLEQRVVQVVGQHVPPPAVPGASSRRYRLRGDSAGTHPDDLGSRHPESQLEIVSGARVRRAAPDVPPPRCRRRNRSPCRSRAPASSLVLATRKARRRVRSVPRARTPAALEPPPEKLATTSTSGRRLLLEQSAPARRTATVLPAQPRQHSTKGRVLAQPAVPSAMHRGGDKTRRSAGQQHPVIHGVSVARAVVRVRASEGLVGTGWA